jgi:hypothetical protein
MGQAKYVMSPTAETLASWLWLVPRSLAARNVLPAWRPEGVHSTSNDGKPFSPCPRQRAQLAGCCRVQLITGVFIIHSLLSGFAHGLTSLPAALCRRTKSDIRDWLGDPGAAPSARQCMQSAAVPGSHDHARLAHGAWLSATSGGDRNSSTHDQ